MNDHPHDEQKPAPLRDRAEHRVAIAALAHQNNFDIAWCKGSVAEKLFAPVRGHPLGCPDSIPGLQPGVLARAHAGMPGHSCSFQPIYLQNDGSALQPELCIGVGLSLDHGVGYLRSWWRAYGRRAAR